MAMLKVFRTPIGFHDAYVAAPSQKAALAAWGADADLFARGVAERVTDPGLMAEPLEKPGQVIRRARGTAAEHLAALPRDRARGSTRRDRSGIETGQEDVAEAGRRARRSRKAAPEPPPKPEPRPSRAKLETLEREMAALDARQRREMREFAAEEARLQRRKAALARSHDTARKALARKLDHARASHEQALETWRARP